MQNFHFYIAMTVSLQTLSEADHRRIAQKEKIKAVYELLQDIPDEKVLFTVRKASRDDRAFYDDPENLRWLAVRIKHRLTEASAAIAEAIERMSDGVLDLSRKNLCDLTIKDFHAPLPGIRKIILSGNCLRTLPPICSLKPFLEHVEAVGNLVDIEPQFASFLRENQMSFDLFQVFQAVCEHEFEEKEEYTALLEEISVNADKSSVVELSHRVHALMSTRKPAILSLEIHPRRDGVRWIGGVRGFIPLNYFSRLESLSLSGCQLESIVPLDWLSNLARLKRLDLSHTPISQIPSSLVGKPIEDLNLSTTRISTLPEWIESLASLKRLNISDTPITYLPSFMHKLHLEHCNLDGTRIRILVPFNHDIQALSIKRTLIAQVPKSFVVFFKENRLLVDDSNFESLKLQARISRQFYSPVVASWVFHGEVYKREEGSVPSSIKTGVVGLKYISAISFLIVWQLCDALFTSVPAPCQMRSHARSSKFTRFREQSTSRTTSLFCALLLYQFLPLSRRWNDVKSIAKFIGK